ncbi:hypothetical protein [Deinococcus peraridilitoris]|uniref:Uncharacterized protein n=1 Tax=Deinococcus peraridilitoris (strain DSM 19664 / LMG 22246 / CIP 109416 / KR-200) TaxID=937777 RepID=L0A0I3_DEIPD|nr:hypothetical protein [Deinococcus peraridilitoris]AFZ67356.1 hypothetical protein Deipe_1840 [Deinococcus peraridilitoris DSM 19664]
MIDTLTCHWVPNTVDRVLVVTTHEKAEVHIDRIRRVLGCEALEALYLRGHFALSTSGRATSQAMQALTASSITFAQAAD